MAAHVHAEKMAMFAEDAKISETPWEFWEVREWVGMIMGIGLNIGRV